MKHRLLPVLGASLLLAVLSGCGAASSSVSPVLPGPQGNLPVDAEMPSAAGFNPPAYIDTARLTAANLEADRAKTEALQYLALHPDTATLTSDDLGQAGLKAWYRFDAASSITRADAVPGGWTDIVFSLSRQKWVRGTPDNDHLADQDIP